MNELALFAGAGGGILAAELRGDRVICAVERDAYCTQVLAQRQNDGILRPFPIWTGIESFDGRPWRGIVDVISGGFPCQDLSCAGKGAGLDGERSGLWREMARIIRQIRPRYAYIENSAMLVNRGLDRLLCDLAAMGFDAAWGVVGADACGFLHKRERIWIVAANTERLQERQKPCGWTHGRMGGQFKPLAQDGNWQDKLAGFRGMGNGLARAVDRTDAIRNGQVPTVAATAFTYLQEQLEVA